ncbi:Uncharacterized protein DAT39_005389 [Clarias magur]|uniref:Uncharacterized protein n=1 Tax=Clarias magur TaxID=1594786 RepID=A0A8J4X5R7_CLAMG|nr:Uncharacterized protein DAT39_005389 [Clarias magur]
MERIQSTGARSSQREATSLPRERYPSQDIFTSFQPQISGLNRVIDGRFSARINVYVREAKSPAAATFAYFIWPTYRCGMTIIQMLIQNAATTRTWEQWELEDEEEEGTGQLQALEKLKKRPSVLGCLKHNPEMPIKE